MHSKQNTSELRTQNGHKKGCKSSAPQGLHRPVNALLAGAGVAVKRARGLGSPREEQLPV